MNLLIDIGNSRIKWGFYQEGGLQFENAVFYKNQVLATVFNHCFGIYERPEQVLVANVAGIAMKAALETWLMNQWQLKPEFIRAQSSYLGLTLGYHDAAEFGWDRWLGLIRLWRDFQKPFCLIGCGSALTFDAVDARGQHLGSLIAPGLHLQRQSIVTQLSGCQLPDSMTFQVKQALGYSTADAVIQGILHMSSGFINYYSAKYQQILGAETEFVITGGDAEILMPLLPLNPHFRPHLVLEGLSLFVKNQSYTHRT